ncbi:DUF2334 domain-containing protein [Ammonifex thiophilus]|nr:DUF2334 domain-containing protein [Ammonifex thiophilus]
MRWLALLVLAALGVVSLAWLINIERGGGVGVALAGEKLALVRLEDVSVWYALQENGLDVLRDLADFFHSEGIPFHISLIPVFKDPSRGIELGIGDLHDPRVRAFNDTLKYMVERGGVVGLHGYTHQCGNEVSAAGFEFARFGEYSRPSYAAVRVKAALELVHKVGIPVTYWETPHYTASAAQYQEFARYFSIIYEPDPDDKRAKKIAVVKGLGGRKAVYFIPAPLGMITRDSDVPRLLSRVDRRRPELASFFYHPFMEYQHSLKTGDCAVFHLDRPNGYLRTLVRELKARGYRFLRVDELVREIEQGGHQGLYYSSWLEEEVLLQ